jgi:hypothetical protein
MKTMTRPALIGRWIGLFLLINVLPGFAFVLTLDLYAYAVSLGATLFVLVWFGFRAESWVTTIHNRWMRPNPGLLKTYRRVVGHMRLEGKLPRGRRAARLMIYRDPSSFALIYRSWLSPGTLLISQGLLAQYREDELRTVIEAGLIEVRGPGVVLATLAALAQSFLVWLVPTAPVSKLFPTPWAGESLVRDRRSGLTPGGALRFLFVLPLIQFFHWLGERPQAGIYWTSSLPRAGSGWPQPVAFQHLYLDV